MYTNNEMAAEGRGPRFLRYALAAAFIAMSGHAFAECAAPQSPGNLPSGKKATKEEMIAAQGKVKEFDTATNTYVACLQGETDAASAKLDQSESDPKKADEKKKKLQNEQTKKQNAAIDKDKDLAAHFNEQLRAFKAQTSKAE